MSISLSPNMQLPIPGVGSESGPDYAIDVNNCLIIVDTHDHTPGYGVQITPEGLNINSTLSFGSNDATDLRTVRFTVQGATLPGASDIGCLYEVGVDLYYNDGNGNQIRMTQSGGVAGTPGSISSLVAPASASYSSATQTFIFQSDALTPANIDGASYILRNLVASSKGLTLAPPNAMAADYTITLPPLPGSTLPVQLSSSGALSTGQISYTQLDSNVQAKIVGVASTVQRFTTGSGTYTLPANALYIKVTMAGGGGGGGGGNGGGNTGGSSGSNTTWADGSGTFTAGGGTGGQQGDGSSGATPGGTPTVGSPPANTRIIYSYAGANGQGAGKSAAGGRYPGAMGGSNLLGGAGAGAIPGGNAEPNTGAGGGGGGGDTGSNTFTGAGGGAGAYIQFYIYSPQATYTYSVGALGSGGSGATGTFNGGNGASGSITVEEFYQ